MTIFLLVPGLVLRNEQMMAPEWSEGLPMEQPLSQFNILICSIIPQGWNITVTFLVY